jgi:hypothetical protein
MDMSLDVNIMHIKNYRKINKNNWLMMRVLTKNNTGHCW